MTARVLPGSWRSLQPLFLDFEASSVTGWPIQVGWASIVDGRIVHEGHLIRPEPEWDEAEWDEIAAMTHGIRLDYLRRFGKPAREVAERVVAAIKERTLVSDAAAYDAAFLRRLLEVREGSPDYRVVDLAALMARMDRAARARLRAELGRLPVYHRAGDDAARLARGWLAALSEPSQPICSYPPRPRNGTAP